MNLKSKIILFMIILNISLLSQDVSLKVDLYYATYEMSSLNNVVKQTQKALATFYDIPMKNTHEFPAYYVYQFNFGFNNFSSFEYGFLYNISSTGARTDYRDYSGYLTTDYLVSSDGFGIYFEHNKNIYSKINYVLGINILYQNTTLEINEILSISDVEQTVKNKFESNSFGFTPYLSLEYTLSFILCRINLGYLISSDAEFHLPDNEEAYLYFNGSKVSSNWSGARIGISLGVKI